MDLNLLDIIFAGMVAGFALLGAMRSAVRELLSLLGLGAGFVAGSRFYGVLADQVEAVVPDRQLAELAAFLAFLLGGYFIGVFLSSLGEAAPGRAISPFNRTLAAGLGLVKGVVACVALYWMIEAFIPPFQDELAESRLGQELARVLAYLSGFNLI